MTLCDQAKARELSTRASSGSYTKAAGEDDQSIALGITGYKGRVHVHFGAPVEQCLRTAKSWRRRWTGRFLPDTGCSRALPGVCHVGGSRPCTGCARRGRTVPLPQNSVRQKANGSAAWANCPSEQQPYLILQYANPVRNQYRIKAGYPFSALYPAIKTAANGCRFV